MRKEFIYILLKLSLYRGNTIEFFSKNFNGKTKIINFNKLEIHLVKPKADFTINDIINLEVYCNGVFKLSGNIVNITEEALKVKLKTDFQYISKRKDFRVPVMLPVIIDEKYRGVILDYNKKNIFSVLIFSNTKINNEKVNIKIKNDENLKLSGKVLFKRDEIFNLEKYIIQIEESSEKLKKILTDIYEYYV